MADLTTLRPAQTGSGSPRLRILLSAYACLPDQGSEPGVGWQWATRLARAGHEVWVLTLAYNRDAIESAIGSDSTSNPRFVYYELPARPFQLRDLSSRWMRWHYLFWQLGAYWAARKLCREVRFDVVHHVTFGVFRHPSFLAFLGPPFVFGPVGGGEAAPRTLRKTFPWRGYLMDLVRDAANWMVRFDPFMAAVFRRSAATLCKTRETLLCIPRRYHEKCIVQIELGTDEPVRPLPSRRRTGYHDFRILYVGRLIYWKGLHLALMAFARLRQTHRTAHFTIVGSGPDASWFRALARDLGVNSAVTWIPYLERAAVMRTYSHHDAFLFPSLHDSSGNVVLEALSCGLPVVCLNTGGPGELVDGSCGFSVRPGPPHEVVARLSDGLSALAEDTALAHSMGAAAVCRAHEHFSWTRQLARMEQVYQSISKPRPVTGYAA